MMTTQSTLRALFCQALSDMYKAEVPLYGDLIDIVWKADAMAVRASQKDGDAPVVDPDDVLPSRHRVERHGAIRVGTAEELATVRRVFAVMGMHPVGYYDLTIIGLPMHATAFRPFTVDALAQNPFRVFTTLLRMELLPKDVQKLAEKALQKRNIFTPRLLQLLDIAENAGLTAQQSSEFIANALETFRWHSEATITLEHYEQLKSAHPLVADVVSFANAHINHLTPRTLDIDRVQKSMVEHGMPAKDRIEGPPKRSCPILLRQTSFEALEELVHFPGADGSYVKACHTARFGEVEQRGFALTRKGRRLYDRLLEEVDVQACQTGATYEKLLETHFAEFPDTLSELHDQGLAFFSYNLTPKGIQLAPRRALGELEALVSVDTLVHEGLLSYEPLTYEDFLPLSAGGIFNSNLPNKTESSKGCNNWTPDFHGFVTALGVAPLDELKLYETMQQESLECCRRQLKRKGITLNLQHASMSTTKWSS